MLRSILVTTLALALFGCVKAALIPPQAVYTEVQPSGRAAKSPNCDMPVLHTEPLADYTKVGIVEGRGSRYATEDEVMKVVRQKACESGADAIVILTSKAQTSEGFTGYYIDATAIIYGQLPYIPTGPAASH